MINKILAGVTFGSLLFVGVSAIPSTVTYERPEEPLPVTVIATTTPEKTETKKETPDLYPLLKRICSCESTGRPDREPQQFDKNGVVIRGKINPLDTGMCQINSAYHGDAAEKMGLDLDTEYGNATYAIYLFDTQGSTPWNWSKGCWGV